jgi:hypothetical protein
MTLSSIAADKFVLLFGAPRSGTTWLAKIFDSHPNVLYRHEPDTVLRDERMQNFFSSEDIPRFRSAAEDYLRRLMDTRTLKTVGSLPVFPKCYYSSATQGARRGMILALRVAEKIGAARLVRNIAIPDLIDPARRSDIRVVMKSVSSRGRARLFAEALPGCRVIYIVRDPCGQVASMMRGTALGKFEDRIYPEELLHTEQAKRYGLTAARLQAMPRVEQFAWNWAILNEKAIDDLAGLGTAKVVRYQELCARPMEVAKELLAFTGLSWNEQTERFIGESTRSNAPDRYYQVFKNTETAMNKWRTELPPEDQRRIMAVVRETSMRALCPEYEF